MPRKNIYCDSRTAISVAGRNVSLNRMRMIAGRNTSIAISMGDTSRMLAGICWLMTLLRAGASLLTLERRGKKSASKAE